MPISRTRVGVAFVTMAVFSVVLMVSVGVREDYPLIVIALSSAYVAGLSVVIGIMVIYVLRRFGK